MCVGTADSTVPSPRILRHLDTSLGQRNLHVHSTPSHRDIAKVLTGLSDLSLTVPNIEITNGPPGVDGDATEAALHAIFRMWKVQNPSGDKADFMLLVERAIP